MKPGENSELIVKTVEVELSDDDRLSVAEEIGELVNEISEKKRAFQLATAHHKSLISSLVNRQETLLQVLASGMHDVEIECRPEYDYREGMVRLISVDSGDVVEEREMTFQEKQMTVQSFSKVSHPDEQVHDDPDTPLVPRCHMKPMVPIETDSENESIVYQCSVCNAEKTINYSEDEDEY